MCLHNVHIEDTIYGNGSSCVGHECHSVIAMSSFDMKTSYLKYLNYAFIACSLSEFRYA